MKLYVRYPQYALAVEATHFDQKDIWLKVEKMYQLLTLPAKVVGEEKDKAFRMLKYDIDKPETFSTPFSRKDFYVNVADAVEISVLDKFPDHPDITGTTMHNGIVVFLFRG